MPLLTIRDLLEGDPVEVEHLVARASGISDLYETFEAEDGGDGHLRAPGIHASEISGCQRKMVYTMRGEPKTNSPKTIWKRRFKTGHAIHGMFQAEFEKMARKSNFCVTFESEVPISPKKQLVAAEWDIHSACDGMFVLRESWDGPAFARCLLEIKTDSPDEFAKRSAPKPEHIEQVHVYMKVLDVPLCWLLYFNKGNQNITLSTNPNFFVRFNPAVWADLEGRFTAGHEHVILKTLPERQEGIVCEFCPYSDACGPKYLERKGGRRITATHWKP